MFTTEYPEFNWLTPEYIKNLLKAYLKDKSLEIKSLEVKAASGKGESFAGILLRAKISYSTTSSILNETSLILKTQIWNDFTEKTLKVYDIHNKEMIIYEKILPKIRQLLLSIGEKGDIFPTAIHVDRENDVIVFEDLLLKKYQMKNRLQGLDREHALLALSKMAKIHAASAVLYEKDNKIYSSLVSGMFTRHTDCYHTFFRTFWSTCASEVSKWEGFEHYGLKMKQTTEDVIENACKAYDLEDGDFHVLTHGDFWVNNIMFRYDEEGSLKDVVVLDWQYATYASPFVDLFFFIFTSTNDEIRINHADLLQFYHKELTETLKKLKYPKHIPTLLEFRLQYLRKSFLKATSSIIHLPNAINEVTDDSEFESLLLDNEKARRYKNTVLKNPKYRQILEKLLPIFDAEGLLDGPI
ncbi:uncharacterized protein LOC134835209 [Culicoides brevitarsis]|uniref:uncharacterized protein LOC134835209 n=1 Tax=Culicoides brevitarsis TaxID=469753 RepID=UPI00307B459C